MTLVPSPAIGIAEADQEALVEILRERMPIVEATWSGLKEFSSKNPDFLIYGFNTLAGHRDDALLDSRSAQGFQQDLIRNHLLGCAPWYDPDVAICITKAKVLQISNGGSIVSPDLYDALIDLIEDAEFQPKVPKNSSYSCGDVIPGAHWAHSALHRLASTGAGIRLQPGEGMALINGSFVHVGLIMSSIARIRRLRDLACLSIRSDMHVCQADPRMIDCWTSIPHDEPETIAALRWIRSGLSVATSASQWPVSFRAIRESIGLLNSALKTIEGALDSALRQPSNNPLVIANAEHDATIPHPQASFLQPHLVLATSNVIEALKFFAWGHVNRMKWMLSGHVEGIPTDGQMNEKDLAFIQWPKLSQAVLEATRMRSSMTPLSFGGDTSYGVEDIWTNGVAQHDVLTSVLDDVERLIAIGLLMKAKLAKRLDREHGMDASWAETLLEAEDFAEATRVLQGWNPPTNQEQELFTTA